MMAPHRRDWASAVAAMAPVAGTARARAARPRITGRARRPRTRWMALEGVRELDGRAETRRRSDWGNMEGVLAGRGGPRAMPGAPRRRLDQRRMLGRSSRGPRS